MVSWAVPTVAPIAPLAPMRPATPILLPMVSLCHPYSCHTSKIYHSSHISCYSGCSYSSLGTAASVPPTAAHKGITSQQAY